MNWLKKPSTITIIIIIGIIVIFGALSEDYTTQPNSYSTNQPTQQASHSNAFKLASLEVGHNNPDQNLINNFENILRQLTQKCTSETESQIADYIYKTKTMIAEKGGNITLMESANSINGSIPDESAGVVTCAEIAAAFVTLYGS